MAAAEQESIRERKRQLALSLDASRSRLTSRGRELRRRLSPANAIGTYFRKHPLRVFGATAAGVAILTYFLRSRHRIRKSRKSLSRRSVGWVLALLKPALRFWFLNQAKTYIHTKQVPPETESLLGP